MADSGKLVTVQQIARFAELSTHGVLRWARFRGHQKRGGRWLWTEGEALEFGKWLRLSTMGRERRAKRVPMNDGSNRHFSDWMNYDPSLLRGTVTPRALKP